MQHTPPWHLQTLHASLLVCALLASVYGWWMVATILVICVLYLFQTYAVVLCGLLLDAIYTPAIGSSLLPEYTFTLAFSCVATMLYYMRSRLRNPLQM